MGLEFDLEAVEAKMLATPVMDRVEITLPPAPEPEGQDAPDAIPDVPDLEIMDQSAWVEQWNGLHDIAGGLLQSRIGVSVPLGTKARDAGGLIAAQATYDLISRSPALSKMILGTQSTFMGQIAMVAMHGVGCVAVIREARITAVGVAAEFTTTRSEDHDHDDA